MKHLTLTIGLFVALFGGHSMAMQSAEHAGSASASMQGDATSFLQDPHMHAFYELTKTTFARGSDQVDEAKYVHDSMAIFHDFGLSRGIDPKRMEDHLKLVPAQMIKIVRDDPSVLASYDTFTIALVGPP